MNDLIHRDYQVVGSEIHVDLFQDRLEITSPGGMLNGKLIQNIDLRHIPSLRRNQIISDVFARLHLMDRRGSGIGRILSGYAEFDRQPEFFSDPDFFIVTLPNKGFNSKSKGLGGKSKGLSESSKGLSEVSKGFSGESQTDSSMELEQFREREYLILPSAKKKTVERVCKLFRIFQQKTPTCRMRF